MRTASRASRVQTGKLALATAVAWIVAGSLVHGQLPVFASVAALLVVQPSVNQSVGRAIERSIGVIVGVLLAYLIARVFGDNFWIVLVGIVLAIAVAWMLRLTPTTATQIPITAMLVLSIGASSSDYALDRILDTIIGATIGVIINLFVVPPVAVEPAVRALNDLVDESAARLEALAGVLTEAAEPGRLDEVLVLARLLRPMREKVLGAFDAANESLAANPLRARYEARFSEARELLTRMTAVTTRTLAMTRTVHDHYSAELVGEPVTVSVADELRRAAHDLRLLKLAAVGAGAEASAVPEAGETVPLLTTPLVVVEPPTDWVLTGSLVEDLRRIHEEITGVE